VTAYRTETLLSVEDVSLSFGDKQILRNVRVKVDNLHRDGDNGRTGQIVSFLGPSGCGKTCLLRILAGLQKPTSGQVFLGKDRHPAKPGLVGLVSQNYVLYRNRTVEGNLEIAARQHGCTATEAREKVKEILTRFDLNDRADLYPAQLSGGQRQRVSIAQQLLCSEHFLTMDEPTSGLDPVAKNRVCSLISEVANQDDLNTLILVSHDIRAMIAVADTIWLMGRDRDAQGNVIPGAYIKREYDLVQRGLAWHPDIIHAPGFMETEREILAEVEQA
jgi:ABC-type nitrate/sulfonate/bicarbonate transport system ATPase subunit